MTAQTGWSAGWDGSNPFPELGDVSAEGVGLAPLPVSPDTVQVDDGRYVRAGVITSADLFTGEHSRFAHLDAVLHRVVDWVQQTLTDAGRVEAIDEARKAGDLSAEYAAMAAEIDRVTLAKLSQENMVHGVDQQFVIATVIDEILGLGPIEPLMRDRTITEVMVNGPDEVYVEIKGREYQVPGARFRSREHLLQICQRIVAPIQRSIDQRNAYVDARLPNGSRVNIVHHALAERGPVLTIRKFPDRTWTMADLLTNRSVDEGMAVLLAWLVRNRVSVLVAGGTGSGKTTLLNAMSGCIPRDQRTITIEDSRELRLHPAGHWVPLEARPAGMSGEGLVTIRDLVRNALRMKPVRIVVGEVRGEEALDMLNAMNTGHEGSLTTIHANGPEETIDRLLTAIAMGGEMQPALANQLIATALDVIVYQAKGADGVRRVTSISEVRKPERGERLTQVELIPLWEWEQTGVDEQGFAVGQYVKRADISERLTALRGLAFAEPVTLDEVYAMSELPQEEPGHGA
jgi:pilus assembly protein CpaF